MQCRSIGFHRLKIAKCWFESNPPRLCVAGSSIWQSTKKTPMRNLPARTVIKGQTTGLWRKSSASVSKTEGGGAVPPSPAKETAGRVVRKASRLSFKGQRYLLRDKHMANESVSERFSTTRRTNTRLCPENGSEWLSEAQRHIRIEGRHAVNYHKGQNRAYVMRQCDCRCCNMLVEKDVWDDGEEAYNISIVDSYYKDQNSLLGRLRRAFGVLMGKSVPYNDVFIGEQSNFEGFVDELKALSEWKPEKTEAKDGSDA